MSKKTDDRRKSSSAAHRGGQVSRWSADRIRKSDRTRRRLLEALEEVLQRQTLSEVSVDEVAAAAGVRRTSFYFYFPSKAVAVAAVLDELYGETFFGASLFMNRSTERTVALREALVHLWSLWQQHRWVMIAVLDARAANREAAEIWERWLARFVAPVVEVIDADRTSGVAPSGPEPAVMVRLLLSMNVASLDRMLRAQVTPEDAEEEIDALTAVWVRSIYGHNGAGYGAATRTRSAVES